MSDSQPTINQTILHDINVNVWEAMREYDDANFEDIDILGDIEYDVLRYFHDLRIGGYIVNHEVTVHYQSFSNKSLGVNVHYTVQLERKGRLFRYLVQVPTIVCKRDNPVKAYDRAMSIL